MDYIEQHKNRFGVEPICAALTSAEAPIAPSTFYAARTRQPSARAVRDEDLKPVIKRVHEENYGVYGIRKVHAQLNREEVLARSAPVARCTTQRLMKELGLRGISRTKGPRTTIAGTGPDTRPDLVERTFAASGPDRLWVADITYVRTFAGWVYCAFVLDVFSRRVLGWQVSTSLRTDLALDALNMGLWTRQHDGHDTDALVHHSDRGVQYTSIRFTETLALEGLSASIGTVGDALDNAAAESFMGLYKNEAIRADSPFRRGPLRQLADVESLTMDYVHWYNTARLHGLLDYATPDEHEAAFYAAGPLPPVEATPAAPRRPDPPHQPRRVTTA